LRLPVEIEASVGERGLDDMAVCNIDSIDGRTAVCDPWKQTRSLLK
jgi:hypothetical protein